MTAAVLRGAPALPDQDLAFDPEPTVLGVLDPGWTTVVWNDPVNLMSYVAWVFRSYFGLGRDEAQRRMMQVHEDGRATLATGTREEMERHVEAMHGYGLNATLERAG